MGPERTQAAGEVALAQAVEAARCCVQLLVWTVPAGEQRVLAEAALSSLIVAEAVHRADGGRPEG